MNIEFDPTKTNVLHIETINADTGGPDGSKFVISGKPDDVLFNWVALTNAICDQFKLSASALAVTLPTLVSDYRRTKLQNSTFIDASQILRRGGMS